MAGFDDDYERRRTARFDGRYMSPRRYKRRRNVERHGRQAESPLPPSREEGKKKKRRKARRRLSYSWSPSWSPDEPSKIEGEESFAVAVLDRKDEEDFGWAQWRPGCLRCCQSPWWFLICLCLMAIGHQFGGNGVLPPAVMQLERRFNFRSAEIALFRASYDVGYVAAMIPFLINAAQGSHGPHWIAIGGLVSGAGAIICTLPHFFSQRTTSPELIASSCGSVPPSLSCTESTPKPQKIFTFAAGFLLMGIGGAPVSVLGITYLDESVSHSTSAVYTGIYALAELLGPMLGIMTTSWLIQVNGDVDKTGSFDRGDQRNPQWYGAWWLSLYVAAAMSLIGSVWMFGYPPKLRGYTEARIEEARRAVLPRRRRSNRKKQRQLPAEANPWLLASVAKQEKIAVIVAVLKCRSFWGLVLEQCSRRFITGGFVLFLPKYMAAMFEASPVDADFFMSTLICGCAICGLVFGTFFQRGLNLKVVGNLRLAILAAVASLICSATFLVSCQPLRVAGINHAYPRDTTVGGTLDAACNQNCNCSGDMFAPMCFYSGVEQGASVPVWYYSACYAGCSNPNEKNGSRCTCFDRLGVGQRARNPRNVPGAVCRPCSAFKLAAFLIGVGWTTLWIYMRMNPVQQAVLRVVPFHGRIVALAISSAAARLTGTAPGGFVVAELVRASCLLRQTSCGEDMVACAWQDRTALSFMATGFTSILSLMSLMGLTFSLLFYRKPEHTPSSLSSESSSTAPSSEAAEERMTWLN